MFKLALLGFAIFSLTGAISSTRITKDVYDHIENPPSNTYVTYGTNSDYQVPLTFTYQSSDYKEYNENIWDYVDYKLYARYNFNSDYSYSRLTFYQCDFNFYRSQDDYDTITWYGSLVFNCDGKSFNDYDFWFVLNCTTNYLDESFTCLFQLDCQLNSTPPTTDDFDNDYSFSVGDEFSYSFYTESSNMRLNFNYFTNYNQGYDDGINYVLTHLSEYDLYTQSQYNAYGLQQYNLGLSQANTGFMQLFGAIADTPVIMIRNLFSFDLFGMSALTIFMTLLTALLVIHFIRKVI